MAGRGGAEKKFSALWRGMAVPPRTAPPQLVAEFAMAIYIPADYSYLQILVEEALFVDFASEAQDDRGGKVSASRVSLEVC